MSDLTDPRSLDPAASALIRSYMTSDTWTRNRIIAALDDPDSPEALLAAAVAANAAALLKIACGSDREALAIIEQWTNAAVREQGMKAGV